MRLSVNKIIQEAALGIWWRASAWNEVAAASTQWHWGWGEEDKSVFGLLKLGLSKCRPLKPSQNTPRWSPPTDTGTTIFKSYGFPDFKFQSFELLYPQTQKFPHQFVFLQIITFTTFEICWPKLPKIAPPPRGVHPPTPDKKNSLFSANYNITQKVHRAGAGLRDLRLILIFFSNRRLAK